MLKQDLDLYYHSGEYFTEPIKHPTIEGKTFSIDDTLYIVFYASYGFYDYLMNFTFPKIHLVADKRYKAHMGFVLHYDNIKSSIEDRFYESQCSKVHIIGYSQGASIALLCAYYLSKIVSPTVVCFEPLAISNSSLKEYLEKNCDIQYTKYGNDTVTKLLFWNRHVGTEHHFGPKKVWWKFCNKDHPLENIKKIFQN